MVASTLVGKVRCDPSYEIKYVKQLIKDKFGYEISYHKVWHSLRRAVENVYGTWKVLFDNCQDSWVPLLSTIQMGLNIVERLLVLTALTYIRSINTKMLIAVGVDANNQIIPLAFAIVDDENYNSWKWFLDIVRKHVIRGARGVCLISDKHRAIVSAVKDISNFKPPRGVDRFCLRHVCSNFNSQYKNVHSKDLCWQAGTQHQIRKFNTIMDAIKNKNPAAYRYLSGIPCEKWTMAHDGGWRRGVMMTNMSECLNGMLKSARRLLISAIVQLTLQRSVKNFLDRKVKIGHMVANNQPWADYAFNKYKEWSRRSRNHCVTRYDISDQSASITTSGRPGRTEHVQVVNLSTRDCSCGKWTIFGIPCSHAICTAKWFSLDPMTFVQPWFAMCQYVNTYEGRFIPIGDKEYWDDPEFELHHNQARCERRRVGRHRTSRIRNEMDQPTTRERQRHARGNVL